MLKINSSIDAWEENQTLRYATPGDRDRVTKTRKINKT